MSRYGKNYEETYFLRQLSKHDQESTCKTCQDEENKSMTSPRFQETNLIDRLIFPQGKCWLCKLTFINSKEQIDHFVKHECKFCRKSFDDPDLKIKHEEIFHTCSYKEKSGNKIVICDEVLDENNYKVEKMKHLIEVHNGKKFIDEFLSACSAHMLIIVIILNDHLMSLYESQLASMSFNETQ